MRALTALVALLLLGAALALQACGGSGGGSGSFDIRDDPRLEQYDDELTAEGQTHYPPTVNVSYETVPPYGGPHDSIPLPCGIYTSEPRFENAVHAMEHGAVVVWYSPRLLDADGLAALNAIARTQLEDSVYTVLAPFGALATPVALASWGERMYLDEVDPAVVTAFIDEFKHDAPEPTAAGGCVTAS